MKSLVIVAMLLGWMQVEAKPISCKTHPIYCQIKKNRSSISSVRAMKLSNVIYKTTRKHNVPANIYTAILMQESRYTLSAKGCHKGIVQEGLETKVVKICSDFGMSQIYYKTAQAFGFDLTRLTDDLEYSVEAGAIVLADFRKRYSHKEITWWTRYNASSKTKREIYKTLVMRFL